MGVSIQKLASAVDDNGDPVFPRQWNSKHIDAPSIGKQKQPSITRQDLERCIKDTARDQERVLYCVLAASGLRISEALAIHISGTQDQTSWNPERQAIDVRSSIFNGREIPRLKTLAARRTVDLDPRLGDLIAKFVEINGIQAGDYLFRARTGRPMHMKTARQRLAKHNIPGFHSFRRYRITRLREIGVPEDIIRYWVGHAGHGITDRYSKLGECADLRKQWAMQAELGFELPELSRSAHTALQVGSSPNPETAAEEIQPQPYIATDEDLPAELFEQPGSVEVLA
jgi:integrase